MLDFVIRNALIYDGSGAKPVFGDVAVADGKIVAVGAELDGIGQNRPVNVIRLITADTIEQRVDAFKELKSHLAESILSSEETFGASLTHEMAMKLFE